MKAPLTLQTKEPRGKTAAELKKEMYEFMKRMDEAYRYLRQDAQNNETRLDDGGL